MKNKVLTVFLLFGMTTVSACVTGTDYLPVSSQTKALNAASLSGMSGAVSRLADNRSAYRNCLLEAYIVKNIEHEKVADGRVSDRIVKSACAEYRDDYYSSVWASSWPLNETDTIQFRHNTATTVLRETDEEMFAFFASKFPASKSVTQQYVDDVRAAQ
ncbi:hypothetical protein [Saliniramus fredricksonii]|uniref:hypothetical protein n=1 Tax=Saliniramus fredricksonii TaxID=1653334 RepID=UPI001042682E|nr:hypothetical protein [Saliniramus fredricksonii]